MTRLTLLLAALGLVACDPLPAPDPVVDPDPVADDDDDDDSTEDPTASDVADDSVIVSSSFPATLACTESATGLVRVRNTGTATWSREDGYKLGAMGDHDPLLESDVRVWLQEGDVVLPGGEYEFEIPLVAPSDPSDVGFSGDGGMLNTDWQMVLEGVHWFGAWTESEVELDCAEETSNVYPLPLPDASDIVDELASQLPGALDDSCQDDGGSWEFMDALVDRLRQDDDRWGYNWKRGVVGDPSEDVVDYHFGPPPFEGSTDVYIIDVIVGHCGPNPSPGWTDQTQATADGGTIGIWTGRGRF